MKKAFTLVELLVVIAIISILAAILMPALNWARISARIASCQHNMHNVGLALSIIRQDGGGDWVRAYYPDAGSDQYCNVWGRLVDGGYSDDVDVFACPVRGSQIARANIGEVNGVPPDYPIGWMTMTEVGDYEDVLNSGYGYDNGRIAKSSNPARVVAADILETEWASFDDISIDGTYDDENHGGAISGHSLREGNHPDCGANALFVDNAVQTILPELVHEVWQVDDNANDVVDRPAGDAATLMAIYRRGIMQNPRLDVGDVPSVPAGADREENDLANWDDHDDIYAIDTGTQNEYDLLTETEFEMSPLGSGYRVNLSKDDANVQPLRWYRHVSGWPEADL